MHRYGSSSDYVRIHTHTNVFEPKMTEISSFLVMIIVFFFFFLLDSTSSVYLKTKLVNVNVVFSTPAGLRGNGQKLDSVNQSDFQEKIMQISL